MTKNRETVGKLATDLLPKQHTNTHSAQDQMSEQLSDYDKNIFECVELNKNKYSGNFYIVVVAKRERLLENVYRHFFLARFTCPTPEYDQTVYKYIRSDECVEFMWCIPDQQACQYLMMNAITLPSEEKSLLNFVTQFSDGTLLREAQKQNGEISRSIHVV